MPPSLDLAEMSVLAFIGKVYMNRNTLIRELVDAAVNKLAEEDPEEVIRLGEMVARNSFNGLFENLSNDHLIHQANIFGPHLLGMSAHEIAVPESSQEQSWNDTLEFRIVTQPITSEMC